ncbi:MAG: hypothetical protein CMJ26_03940 [Phycisphaerae bacterium]|nr:hypothetical protein [Phycisphaerae bacterium]|tara:strand:- start:585 stop:1652 length:1068 start_codon:yes stop_codon:yes gene_type:complete
MLGYCTNVHSGDSFIDVLGNLKTYSCKVQQNGSVQLGVGLWLSDLASREVDTALLKDTLKEYNLHAFTFNGFPFSNFHQERVRHKVYKPDWSQDDRLEYTVRLAKILSSITDQDEAGISTLPLGWNNESFTNEECALQLNRCVDALEEIEQQTSKCIHIDIETEPGCRLQRSSELCEFFATHFRDDQRARRYIRVCHDTCHAAIMRESAEDCVTHYKNAGLAIGKVQLSSAIEFELSAKTNTSFIRDEQTYLHQTTIETEENILFFEHFSDVPSAVQSGNCRVHFHVPIHKNKLGELRTTQHDLIASIPILQKAGATDWEVETYTWSVTPKELQEGELVSSITKELAWAKKQISQ